MRLINRLLKGSQFRYNQERRNTSVRKGVKHDAKLYRYARTYIR